MVRWNFVIIGCQSWLRSDLASRALTNLSPPRLRLEEALLDVASQQRRESETVAVLADACQQALTTPPRLLAALHARKRIRQRRLLLEVLGDVAAGVRSVLERRFVRDVERPHGLPTGRRQRRVITPRAALYRDVEYIEQTTVIELDGRIVHERVRTRWADLERDLEATISGRATVRLGWGHLLERCRTAAALARLLLSRGRTDTPHGCSPDCPVQVVADAAALWRQRGGLPAARADDPPQSG